MIKNLPEETRKKLQMLEETIRGKEGMCLVWKKDFHRLRLYFMGSRIIFIEKDE